MNDPESLPGYYTNNQGKLPTYEEYIESISEAEAEAEVCKEIHFELIFNSICILLIILSYFYFMIL